MSDRNANSPFTYLYRDVKFYIGIKAVTDTGKLNEGITLKKLVWNIHKAIDNIESQRKYVFSHLHTLYGEQFKTLTGRDLQVSDLRVSFVPADTLLHSVMLDDIDDTCGAHIYVETSPGNFQGHFMLNRPATEFEAMCAIRMLRDYHDSDPGAARPRQARRFVMEGMSCTVDWSAEKVDVDFAVKHYAPDTPTVDVIKDVSLTDLEKAFFRDIWERKLRSSPRDYDHPLGNPSHADFGLATYLLEHGHDPSVVKAAIISSRTSLYEDKGNWAEGYLRKTINAAMESVEKKAAQTEAKKRLSL